MISDDVKPCRLKNAREKKKNEKNIQFTRLQRVVFLSEIGCCRSRPDNTQPSPDRGRVFIFDQSTSKDTRAHRFFFSRHYHTAQVPQASPVHFPTAINHLHIYFF